MASEITQQMLDQSVKEDEVTIDVEAMEDEVTIDVEAMFKDTEDRMLPPECCIYRVPHTIRDQNPDAYTPKVVSIGPFHHHNDKLRGMERHKQAFSNALVKKSGTGLKEFVRLVTCLEPKVRASYSDNIDLDEKKLVKLILMDAAFIIELFMMVYKDNYKDESGRNIFPQEHEISEVKKRLPPWSLDGIAKDLILLENQLPFFVIEELFTKAFRPSKYCCLIPSFRELTYHFFDKRIPCKIVSGEIKHITDLLRLSFLSGSKISDKREKTFINGPRDLLLYSATELKELGVRLKASTNSDECLLNLKLSRPETKLFGYLRVRRPVLEIPEIFLEDRTEILFRNMIALEQCHYHFESYITDYAFVLDCLINAQDDAELLTHRKIIHNFLGDTSKVATLFNGLRKNIIGESISSDYHGICTKLNKYCEDHWNKRMALLKRDYCNTPWHALATTAAIVVIILTLVQTLLSFLQILA